MMFVRTAGEPDLEAIRALPVEAWHAAYEAIYGAARVTEITGEWHSLVRSRQPDARKAARRCTVPPQSCRKGLI